MLYFKEAKCAYVVLVMSFYWFTEAIPISVTALLPLILYPLLGIMSSNMTSKAYINVRYFYCKAFEY